MMEFCIAPTCEPGDLSVLSASLKQISLNDAESARLAALRDYLLPKLMSGEIDISQIDTKQLNSHLARLFGYEKSFSCLTILLLVFLLLMLSYESSTLSMHSCISFLMLGSSSLDDASSRVHLNWPALFCISSSKI